MRTYIRQHHVGLIALLLVILSGSSAYAAATIGAADIKANAVRGTHIANGQVTGADVATNTLTGSDIGDNSVTGTDVNEGTLSVSHVVARARGATPTRLFGVGPTAYPFSSGASFVQQPDEIVSGFYAQVSVDGQGCTGPSTMVVKVDGTSIGSTFVIPQPTLGTLHLMPLVPTPGLFEPGVATARTITAEFSTPSCPISGPVVISGLKLNIVGIR